MNSSFLVSKFFSKWSFFAWLMLLLSGVFLFFRFPASGYESLIEFVSDLLQQKYGSGGSKLKIDTGFHKLSVLLMALGMVLLLYFSFWKWLIQTAAANTKTETKEEPKLKRIDWILILFCTLVGISLRILPLSQSLWQDEIGVYNMFIKEGIFSTLFPKSSMGSQPLMQIVVGLFSSLFGNSEIALRMPLFIVAIASIGLMYFFTFQLLKNRASAFISALFLSLHSYHVYYSFQMRGYVMLVFLCLLSCYLLFRLLQNPNKKLAFVYSIVGILLVFTHLYAVYLLIAQQFVILLFQLKRKSKTSENSTSKEFLLAYFHGFLLAMLISVTLYLPQLPVIFMNILDTAQANKSLAIYFGSVLDSLNFMLAYSSFPWFSFGILMALLLLFIFIIEQNKSTKLIGLIALVLFLITAFVPSGSGFFPRYLICEIPLLVFILAHSIENLWSSNKIAYKIIALSLMGAYVFLNVSGYKLSFQKIQDYKGAVEFVKNYPETKRKVIVANSLGKTEIQHYNPAITPLNNVSELDSLLKLDIDLFAITTYESFAGRSVFKNDKLTQEKIERDFFHEKVFPGEFPVNVWHFKKNE
jgi:hypothetical protein